MNISDDGFSLTYWEENYRRESRIFLKTILDPFPRKKEKLKGINTFFFICVAFRLRAGVLRKLAAFSTFNFNFTWKKRNIFVCHKLLYFLGWAVLNNILKYFCIFSYPASLHRFDVDFFEIFERYLFISKPYQLSNQILNNVGTLRLHV